MPRTPHTQHGEVIQNGYVVADLDDAIEHWLEHTGIGPWTVFRDVTLHGNHLGEETVVEMDVAMAYSGSLQIELMQITSDTPSPYADPDGTPRLGLHHIAWLTDDLDGVVADATRRGLRVLFRTGNASMRVAYLDSEQAPGVIFEYIEGASMPELLRAGIAQSRDWDGTDPVRVVPTSRSAG